MKEKEFIDFLKDNFIISGQIRNEGTKRLENLYFLNDNYYYSIATPHSGNDYKYLTRKNAKSTFDRWSNSEEEYFFDNYEQVINYLKEEK